MTFKPLKTTFFIPLFKLLVLIGFAVSAVSALAVQPARAEFRAESLDNNFPDEIAAAKEQGKFLVIMFQQIGCPYCEEMRARVYPDPKVQKYYTKRFVLIESNIRGSLSVVSPQGKAMTEKKYARKNRVRATPTFIYFDKNGKQALKVTGFMDIARFIKAGQYVVKGVYKTKTSFYRYLQKSMK
ncbi:MAG TPA: thioredoxin [Alphaproteobacteria bacterium]|nr:thioredoxin [Alphaproteobacteria bacterium]